MTWLHSIVLGVVEGITEFLPISSTGHLILVSDWLGIQSSDFTKTFEIFIQLGAILAVVALYWQQWFNWTLIKKLIVAFVPTGLIGLALYKIVKTYLLGNTAVVLWSLLIGGLLMIFLEKSYHLRSGTVNQPADISYRHSFLIGLFQSLAIIPGVSRSAATILGGLSLGLKRETIVEFSFLLAVPTMVAASGLDLLNSGGSFSGSQIGLLSLGFVVSFVVALFSIRWLLKYIHQHNFVPFGIYRIVLALVFGFWLLI